MRAGLRPALLLSRQGELGEVVDDALVRAVLFEDFENAGVLVVVGGKNFRRFTGQEDAGVSATAIDEAADDDHERREASGR